MHSYFFFDFYPKGDAIINERIWRRYGFSLIIFFLCNFSLTFPPLLFTGTAVCGLMGLWLAGLKSATGGATGGAIAGKEAPESDNAAASDYQKGANAARDVVEEVLNRFAKERFTKDHGDAIVNLSKKEAAFIEKMIKSPSWRKLLIDMSAMPANKDSTLFM